MYKLYKYNIFEGTNFQTKSDNCNCIDALNLYIPLFQERQVDY